MFHLKPNAKLNSTVKLVLLSSPFLFDTRCWKFLDNFIKEKQFNLKILEMSPVKHYFTSKNMENLIQNRKKYQLFKVYTKNYYKRIEVSQHNKMNDFWVVINNRVLNLTELLKKFYKDTLNKIQTVSK